MCIGGAFFMLLKTKNVVSTLIIIFLVFSLCLLAGCSDEKYIDDARSEVKTILEENNIDYREVEITYSNDYTYENKTFKFYDLIVNIDSEYDHDYALMLSILKIIENSSYSLEPYSKRNIVFQEYIRCDGVKYVIDSTNEFVLRIDGDYSWEYNGNSDSQSTSTDSSVTQAEQLASEFTLDFSSSYGKKLEDAWLEDQSNVEISAMYHYYNAKMYDSIGSPDMACDEMKHISSSYSGVMSQEILQYGLEIFGSISEWDGGTTSKQQHEKTITDSKRAEIKNWINDRYDYYDNLEGKYCGDKYTDTIFNEAAEKFGFTYEEIYNIWCDLPL